MVRVIAPILPHLAEELWESSGRHESLFLNDWLAQTPAVPAGIESLLAIRSQLLAVSEVARAEHGLRSAAALDISLSESVGDKGELDHHHYAD